MKIYDIIFRSFFPSRCDMCGEVIEINKTRCDACSSAQKALGKKIDAKMSYDASVAPYIFKDSVRKGIHRLKYNGYKELAPAFAKEMADVVSKEYANVHFDLITYIPMTKRKQRKRGYNQTELLAKELSKCLKIPCVSTLKKVKNTKPQQGMNKKQREINLKKAFVLADVNVKGKTILIVDDVKTTGSTLNECSKVLKKKKADKVFAVTIAITGKK